MNCLTCNGHHFQESGRAESQQSVKKMFVGGVKEDTTEDMVRETFASYGEIASVDLITDKHTGKARGFCFVTFEDHDSVDKAVCTYPPFCISWTVTPVA